MSIAEYVRRFGGWGGKGRLADGKMATAVLVGAPQTGGSSKNSVGRYPHNSWAMGCHPDQGKEMGDYLAGQGCPTEIAPDGDLVIRSQGHLRKVHKALGVHDKNGTF